MEIPRNVSKLGGSWVIKLDTQTRQLLKIEKEGDVIILKKKEEEKTNPPNVEEQAKDLQSY